MISSKAIKNNLINDIIAELAKEGDKVINNAFKTKTTKNETFNEHDAFVYGVFFNGELKKYGFIGSQKATEKTSDWKREGIKSGYGRDWAEEAIKGYKSKGKGFELVVLVCTFYSSINEGRGYKVISQSISGLDAVAMKYGGRVTPIT